MVEAETTVDSIRLATSSMPTQHGKCCFESHQAVSQVRYQRNMPPVNKDKQAFTFIVDVKAEICARTGHGMNAVI